MASGGSQVKVGRKPTATGRGKKPFLEEVVYHWEKNSLQVHFMMHPGLSYMHFSVDIMYEY